MRAIARQLGRAASTISREVRRNVDTAGRYRPHRAEQIARARSSQPRARRVTLDNVLGETVAALLAKRWSPEQVAHELRERFTEAARWLCPESIYQAIYDARTLNTRPARRRRRRRRLAGGWQRASQPWAWLSILDSRRDGALAGFANASG